jgi:hypothetical protein
MRASCALRCNWTNGRLDTRSRVSLLLVAIDPPGSQPDCVCRVVPCILQAMFCTRTIDLIEF